MANSYTVEPNVLPGTAIAKQQAFLRANHHNISPWMDTPEQIKARNHALFLMEFDRASRALAPDAGEGEV